MNVKPRKGYKFAKSLFGKYENIPEDWDIKKLVDTGKIVGGGTPDSKNEEYWSGDVLWAVPTDITKLSTTYIHDTERKITKKGLDNSSAKLLPVGTILLTSRATMGECAINTRPMSTNQGFQNIVCNNMFYNVFVFYLMRFNRNTIIRLSYGTTFLEISKKEIEKILVPVPNSLTEQQKIASILSGVDANIEATQKVIEKTERLRKGLMQKLFTRGIGHTKFKKSKFGKIPKSWNVSCFERFIKIIAGDYFPFTEFAEQGIPVLKIDNVMYGQIDWTTTTYLPQKYLNAKDVIMLKEGDIVLALNRPITNNKIKIAKLRKKDIPSILYQRVGKFEFQGKYWIDENYFFIFVKSHTFKLILERILVGSDQPYVKTTEILKQEFPYPINIAEQKQIASILSGVDANSAPSVFFVILHMHLKYSLLCFLFYNKLLSQHNPFNLTNENTKTASRLSKNMK